MRVLSGGTTHRPGENDQPTPAATYRSGGDEDYQEGGHKDISTVFEPTIK
jgi:hypothetical protein